MDQPVSDQEACRILEIPPDAEPAQIQQAYRRMVMIWHPDRFEAGTPIHAEATEKFKKINEAYGQLKDRPSGRRPAQAAPQPNPKSSFSPEEKKASPPGPGVEATLLTPTGLLVVGGVLALLLGAAYWGKAGTPASKPLDPSQPEGLRSGGIPGPSPYRVESIDRPGLYIFSPRPEETRQSQNTGEYAAFSENVVQVQREVRKLFPEVEVRLTSADELRFEGIPFFRKQTCGFGYILHFPPAPLRILEGLQPPQRLTETLSSLIPPAATPGPSNTPKAEASLPSPSPSPSTLPGPSPLPLAKEPK